jgi:hypothetical protein
MISSWLDYFWVGGASIVVALVAYLMIDNAHLRNSLTTCQTSTAICTQAINNQNAAIESLNQQMIMAEARVNAAQLNAGQIAKKSDALSFKIMNTQVAADCKSAVKWGALYGRKMFECWAVDCPTGKKNKL